MRADMQSHRGDQHQCEGVGCPTHAESRPRQDESEAQPCSFLGAAMRARGTCSAQPRGRPLPAAACQKPESLLAGRAMLLPKQQRARAWRRRRVLRRRRGVLRRRLARRLRRVQRRRRADGCGAARGALSATRMISRAAAQCRRTGALERAERAGTRRTFRPAKLASGAPRNTQSRAQCCPARISKHGSAMRNARGYRSSTSPTCQPHATCVEQCRPGSSAGGWQAAKQLRPSSQPTCERRTWGGRAVLRRGRAVRCARRGTGQPRLASECYGPMLPGLDPGRRGSGVCAWLGAWRVLGTAHLHAIVLDI